MENQYNTDDQTHLKLAVILDSFQNHTVKNDAFRNLSVLLDLKKYCNFIDLYWSLLFDELKSQKSKADKLNSGLIDIPLIYDEKVNYYRNEEEEFILFRDLRSSFLIYDDDLKHLLEAFDDYNYITNNQLEGSKILEHVYKTVESTSHLFSRSKLEYLIFLESINHSILNGKWKSNWSNSEIVFSEIPAQFKEYLLLRMIKSYLHSSSSIDTKANILSAFPYLLDFIPEEFFKKLAKWYDGLLELEATILDEIKDILIGMNAFKYISKESAIKIFDTYFENFDSICSGPYKLKELIFEIEYMGLDLVPQKYLHQTCNALLYTYINYQVPTDSEAAINEVNPMPYIRSIFMNCNLTTLNKVKKILDDKEEFQAFIKSPSDLERFESFCSSIWRKSDVVKE